MKNVFKAGIARIKNTVETVKHISKNVNNVYGFECPDCCSVFQRVTARSSYMYDEQYKKYKFYIHCKNCGRTTPALPTLKDAIDQWEDQWILKEDSILLDLVDARTRN